MMKLRKVLLTILILQLSTSIAFSQLLLHPREVKNVY